MPANRVGVGETIAAGVETAVSNVAIAILAANQLRSSAIIQNVGTANIRVGIAGVTITTGIRLIPNQTWELRGERISKQELYAIRETGSDSIALAMEAT